MNAIDKANLAIAAEKARSHIPDVGTMVQPNHPESPDSSRPSWEDAPDWARWLAQDEDGSWWWYGDEPHLALSIGEWRSAALSSTASHVPNWRETLEERPR